MSEQTDFRHSSHQLYDRRKGSMLVRSDTFRDVDRLFAQLLAGPGRATGPSSMAADAWREGDTFFLALDMPGVDPGSGGLDIDRNVLSVRSERRVTHENPFMTERWQGTFSRQFMLGDTLDTEDIQANYEAGVLTLRIPIAERAKPRKIAINSEHALSPGNTPDSGDRALAGSAS